MNEILKNIDEKMLKQISNMENRFASVRAGRANASLLDNINVDYYGVPTSVKSLANISIPEARQLVIKPFDKSVLSAIEKAIFEANIGITPNNNGESVFLVIPPLTEERRKELVKEVKAFGEDAKIAIRNIRQDGIKSIANLKLPKDEEQNSNDEVQDIVGKYNKIIDEKVKEKEKELMTI